MTSKMIQAALLREAVLPLIRDREEVKRLAGRSESQNPYRRARAVNDLEHLRAAEAALWEVLHGRDEDHQLAVAEWHINAATKIGGD